MNAISSSPILEKALRRLRTLYKDEGLEPGVLEKVGLKQQWNVAIGTNEQCGVAINFTGKHAVYEEADTCTSVDELKGLIGKPLFEVAERSIRAGGLQNNSIALAALNALSQPLLDEASLAGRGFRCDKAILDFIKPDDVVTVVGYGGMVREFLGKCKELHVTEMRPRETFESVVIGKAIERGPRDVTVHPAEENEAVLSRSDVVIITGSTLVNGTFDEVVGYSGGARVVGLYGPSAQLLPDVLFENGVDVIQSVRIVDRARFEYDVINDIDMEVAIKSNQKKYLVYKNRPGLI